MPNSFGMIDLDQGIAYYQQGNYPAAVQCFRQAMDKCNLVARNNLSIMYMNGQGVPQNDMEAFVLMEQAASGGFEASFYPTAYKYFYAVGTERNLESARYWAQKTINAGKSNVQEAQAILEQIYQAYQNPSEYDNGSLEFDRGIQYYQQGYHDAAFRMTLAAAKKGHAGAMNNVGFFYANGVGVERNEKEAFVWMKQACEHGFVNSYHTLALKYLTGSGTAPDLAQASYWAEQFAKHHPDHADNNALRKDIASRKKTVVRTPIPQRTVLFNRAMNHFNSGEYTQALELFRQAADMGLAVAMSNIGVMYRKGLGVPMDTEEAFRWQKKSAENGYTKSYYYLAKSYFDGNGTPMDLEQAIYWANKGIEVNENADDCHALLKNIEVRKNETDFTYRKSFPGEMQEQVALGARLYDEKRYEEALKILEPAARQGYPQALRIMGYYWHQGILVEKNVYNGFRFMQEAAFRGDRVAQGNIAKMYNYVDKNCLWFAYAQDQKTEKCQDAFTNAVIQERSQKGVVEAVDNRDAMLNAAECRENHRRNPYGNHVRGQSTAKEYFRKAMRYGNLDAVCGLAECSDKQESMEWYRVAAYMGHSYAMYCLAMCYDEINYFAANACYCQAARWGYAPAVQVCRIRGIEL